MAGEDILLREILEQLRKTTEVEARTLSELVRDVRDALKGTSEPTVRSAILDVKTTIEHEFAEIRRVLGQGGMGSGTIARPPAAAGGSGGNVEVEGIRTRMQKLEQHLDDVLSKLERATVALEGGGHGGGGDRMLHSYFERDTYLSITQAVDDIEKGAQTFGGALRKLVGQQETSIWKDFHASILQVTLHTVNLASQMRNLHGVLRQEIQGISTSGVYGSNVLGPMEYFLEGPKRLMSGILTETDSFRTALRAAHDAIKDDMVSPMVLTGKDLVELSHDFRQARQGMRDTPGGFDNRGWMAFEETNKALQDMLDFQHRMGIQSSLTDTITTQNTSQSLNYLKVIATMTGQTVGALEKSLNEQLKQQQALAGLGRLSPDEAKMRGDLMNGFSETFKGVIKPITEYSNRLMYLGRNREQILSNPDTTEDVVRGFALEPRFMDLMLRFNQMQTAPLQRGETLEAREAAIENLVKQIVPAIQNFVKMGGPNGNVAAQVGAYGPFKDILAGIYGASNTVLTRGAETQAQLERRETNPAYAIVDKIREYFVSFVQPFFGLTGALSANTLALWANTGLLGKVAFSLGMSNLGGGGGMLGALGKGIGTVGRFAMGAGAGLGAIGGATDIYQNYSQGNTGQMVGGIAGAGAGALAGGAIGALTGWFTGPFGAIVGAAIGEYLGSFVAGKFATPAVSAPSNVVGPDAASAGLGTSAADSSLSLLTQIVQLTGTGNVALGEIRGELSRQTGYLAGGGTSGTTPYNAQGLTSGTTPAVAAERRSGSDASFPWVGAF